MHNELAKNPREFEPFRISVKRLTPSLTVAGILECKELHNLVQRANVGRKESDLLTQMTPG